MRDLNLIFVVIFCLVQISSQQHRVPPGVPPQQYAQQQMHQQQHMQHQQVPVQHVQHHQQVPQQVPMQQVPVQQVPMQQVPVQQQQQFAVPQHQVPVQQQQQQQVPVQHVQHHPAGQQQLLNVAHMQHENKEHLKEHLNVPIDTSNMSEQELQFHYFKMHDADNNNKLDGCELIKSLIHWHVEHKEENHLSEDIHYSDEEITAIVEPLFQTADKNNDGYLDYSEYISYSGQLGDANHSKD